ncbi:hypothetical protein T4A_11742 [Trichinella pseudospiralis]|uniref:Uncharacterized protein n=1 Tax=Trichinella pseudospiralis TaxID=6337 RepID=A0A0V1E3V3_TRIPS|nr:hypothetical protein T4A_11742 [Trichinella pseudospiralis]
MSAIARLRKVSVASIPVIKYGNHAAALCIDVYYKCLVEFVNSSVSCELRHIGYKAVVTLELSRFHIFDVAFQKYLCDVSGR